VDKSAQTCKEILNLLIPKNALAPIETLTRSKDGLLKDSEGTRSKSEERD